MVPDHYIGLEDVMSNFDGEINVEIAEKLKQGEYQAGYPGWNFYGNIWYTQSGNGQYCCDIWQNHMLKETISFDTLEEIMGYCCKKYGAE